MGLMPTLVHRNKHGYPLKRGLRGRTPPYKLAAANPHRIIRGTPTQAAWLAKVLEMWLNDQYGDCVSAEECAWIANYTSGLGLPEVHIADDVLMAFCRKNDLLNGADLDPVIKLMQTQGLTQDGVTYTDGPEVAVDYSNEAVLQNAISIAPVKLAIDANALPSGAGNANGWVDFEGSPGQYQNTDHCIQTQGYGPTTWCAQQLQKVYNVTVNLPSNALPTCYFGYTWSTAGLFSHNWIMSTVVEAWLRQSLLANGVPVGPGPGPGPQPIPTGKTYATSLGGQWNLTPTDPTSPAVVAGDVFSLVSTPTPDPGPGPGPMPPAGTTQVRTVDLAAVGNAGLALSNAIQVLLGDASTRH